jgi:hypothetical protein
MGFRAGREPVARDIENIKRVIVAIGFEALRGVSEQWLHNVPEAGRKDESNTTFPYIAIPRLQELQTLPGKFNHRSCFALVPQFERITKMTISY